MSRPGKAPESERGGGGCPAPDQQVAPVQVAVLELARLLRHPHRQRHLQSQEAIQPCHQLCLKLENRADAVQATMMCHEHTTGIGTTPRTSPPGHSGGYHFSSATMCLALSTQNTVIDRTSTCSRMLLASARVRNSKRSRSVPPSATTNTMYSCRKWYPQCRLGPRNQEPHVKACQTAVALQARPCRLA